MERRCQVESALGEKNVQLLLHEIDEGWIKDYQVKGIALGMGNGVHGVYVQKKHIEKQNLCVTMRHMLDHWWKKVLFDENMNGVQQLFQILQKNDLQDVAHRMKENSPQRPPEQPEGDRTRRHIVVSSSDQPLTSERS